MTGGGSPYLWLLPGGAELPDYGQFQVTSNDPVAGRVLVVHGRIKARCVAAICLILFGGTLRSSAIAPHLKTACST
jgi:hypothetical protein